MGRLKKQATDTSSFGILKMVQFRIGLVYTGIAALDMKYAEDCNEALLKKITPWGYKIIAHDLGIVDTGEALAAAERMRKGDIDVLVVLVGTFTQDPVMTSLVRNVQVPIVFWATPEVALKGPLGSPSNSGGLVGTIMNASALSKMGMRFKVIFGEPTDQKGLQKLRNTIEAVRVLKELRMSKIGLFGYHSPGFYDGSVDEVALRQHVGAELVHVDLSELYSTMEKVSDNEARLVHERVTRKIVGLNPEEKNRDAKIYLAMKKLVDMYKLDAVASKCWPELSFSSCFALSALSDAGVPGGCEGDVNATVTMLLLHRLTGRAVYLCDVFHLDEKKNTILTYHCGAAAASLASKKGDITLKKHPLGCGVTVEFPVKPGRVTVARMGSQAGRYRMFIASGEALRSKQIVRGNPVEIKLDAKAEEFLSTVTRRGIEHHFLVVHGDWSEKLQEICEIGGFEKILI